MKKMFFALLMLGLIMTSCGDSGNPSSRADDLCGCFKDAGVDFDGIKSERDLERLGKKMENLSKKKEKKAKKCVLAVAKDIQSDIKEMNDEETAEYMRNLVKAGIDTECATEAMEDFDYGEVKDVLDDAIDDMEDDLEDK